MKPWEDEKAGLFLRVWSKSEEIIQIWSNHSNKINIEEGNQRKSIHDLTKYCRLQTTSKPKNLGQQMFKNNIGQEHVKINHAFTFECCLEIDELERE